MALPSTRAPSASTHDGEKTHWELNGRARTQDTLGVRHFHCTERKSKQTGQTLEVRHSRYPPRVQRTDPLPDTTLATAKSPIECVGQHHIARRRAPMKDAKTMAAMAAGLVTERDREDKSYLTAQGKAKPCECILRRQRSVISLMHFFSTGKE